MSVGRAIRHVGRPEGSWTLTMEDAMTAFQLFSYWESLPSAPASRTLHASYRERRRICNETHSLYTTHEVGSVSSMRIYDQLTVVTDERVQLDYLLLERNKVTQCDHEGDIGCLQTTLTTLPVSAGAGPWLCS